MTCQPRFGLCTLILNFRGISSTPRSISLSPFPRKSLTKFRMSWRGPFSMQCQLTFPSMPSPRSSTSGTEGWPSTLWCTSWIWCRDESRARWADFSPPCIWLRCIVNTSSFRLLISWLRSTPLQFSLTIRPRPVAPRPRRRTRAPRLRRMKTRTRRMIRRLLIKFRLQPRSLESHASCLFSEKNVCSLSIFPCWTRILAFAFIFSTNQLIWFLCSTFFHLESTLEEYFKFSMSEKQFCVLILAIDLFYVCCSVKANWRKSLLNCVSN